MKLFKKNGSVVVTAFLPLIILTIIVLIECVLGGVSNQRSSVSPDFTEGWHTLSGEEISLSQLPKESVSIQHSLAGKDTVGKAICFKTSDSNITVSFDENTAYEYQYVQRWALYGKSYGMYFHTVPIPNDASTVTVKLTPLYEAAAPRISMLRIEKSGEFLNSLYQTELPGFALCVLILLYGVMMLIVGILTRGTSESSNIDFFSLGAFSILIGVYSVNETGVLQMITERPEFVRFCAAVSLMFISYFPVSFIASVTHQRKTVCLPILFLQNILNFAVTVLLSLLGISDVARMLTLSHIGIAAAVIMTFYLMWQAVRKKTNDKNFLHTIITGMSFAMAGAGVDLLRYLLIPNRLLGNSIFTRVGVLIFVVLMGIHLMRERARIAVERERSALMEKLAYTDGMTGLPNPRAFYEKETEIRTQQIDCIVVQLDINNLKRVNDIYGHVPGDRHIIGAANIISSCFADIGTCFRTGGDEFIVIAQEELAVKNALEELETMMQHYNETEKPPVPMQIAYGYAIYSAQTDVLETVEQLADQRMYEKKKLMKSESMKDHVHAPT